MEQEIYHDSDTWLEEKGPRQNVVVSSRARLARNLSRIPFATHANKEELSKVSQLVDRTIKKRPNLKLFQPIILREVSSRARRYLKESHIISPEMEKGTNYRLVYLSPDFHISIMVNEEDHLRIQGLVAGFQLKKILDKIFSIEEDLTDSMNVAFSEQFGYLTACPTNLGTGLRISVMLHLPGLVMTRNIDDTLKMLQPHGLTFRGFYGENSEFSGDLYQVSNEISLGKTEEEIVWLLTKVVETVIEREEEARNNLFTSQVKIVEDTIWRSYGLLTQARTIDTQEAMKLLSRIRLGIDKGYFKTIDHYRLNRLIIEIQPAHLEHENTLQSNSEARDSARAELLRNLFNPLQAEPGNEN